MLKPLLPAIIVLVTLATLATLAACTEPTPTPTPEPTVTPAAMAAATKTQTQTATPMTTETPTANPAATPADSTTHEPTETPPPDGRLAPLRLQDSQALQSALSEGELACIGDVPETLAQIALAWPTPESRDELLRLIGCLSDETLARLSLAGLITGPEPISLETSDCVRAAFAVVDPQEVMTAGIEDDAERAGRATAASTVVATVTTACLTDEEWKRAPPMMEMEPQDRADQQCLLETLGGPGKMAEAMLAAQEGDLTSMANAAAECGLDMGPMPVTPETATSNVATPAPVPATPMPTPTPTTTATTVPSTPAPTMATNTLVITVAEIPANIPEYSRSEWKHWVDEDGDCQDARQEVLIAESLVSVTFETDRQCRVETGRWFGAFTSVYVEDPSDLDIDHLVPLKNAHLSGAWRWDADMRQEYANYLEEEDHLIAVTAGANRSKGAKGPEEWGPPDLDYWCQYATDWAEIKERWELTMTPVESEIVMDMMGTCENPPEYEVETLDYLGAVSVTGEDKQTAEPESQVYGSCEEAAAAGEERVQGSSGGGEGFPKAMVPRARDGDGDGLVCET